MLKNSNSENFYPFDESNRQAALMEAHARPPIEIEPDGVVTHYTFQASDEACIPLASDLRGLDAERLPRFMTGKIGESTIKLEKHTEFFSCTILDSQSYDTDDADRLSQLLQNDDFFLLTNISISLFTDLKSMLKALQLGERPVGGKMHGGFVVQTTLKPDANGCLHFQIFSNGMNKHELGRRIQRLLEMETYRVLCLLGLETARSASAELTTLEGRLDQLIAKDAEGEQSDGTTSSMLNQLADLSSSVNALRASMRFRISASKAYYDLVVQRLASLEEEKSGDMQTLTGFVCSRLDPAMATIRSVDQRQRELSNEISNALSLLRTRIDVELNQANQQSLQAMSKSHSQQLLISQTVEGLSIVAISYYAVGLISYVLKSLISQGLLDVSPTVATGISVPIVITFVAIFLIRLRRHWKSNT